MVSSAWLHTYFRCGGILADGRVLLAHHVLSSCQTEDNIILTVLCNFVTCTDVQIPVMQQ